MEKNRNRHYFILKDLRNARVRALNNPHRYAVSIWSPGVIFRKVPADAVPFSALADKFWIVNRDTGGGKRMEICSTAEIEACLQRDENMDVHEGPFGTRTAASDHLDEMWESP